MSHDSPVVIGCRTIRMGGKIYMRLEDVAYLIRSIGKTEETDVRNRCNEFAANVEDMYGDKCLPITEKNF